MKMKREELNKLYPKGTVLKLTEPIEDPYTPKKAGELFTVSYADDNGQLHGSWASGGSIAIVVNLDKFEVVG